MLLLAPLGGLYNSGNFSHKENMKIRQLYFVSMEPYVIDYQVLLW